MSERLLQVISKWGHDRDRGYWRRNDSEPWKLLWDSGCHELCKKCQIENVLREFHGRSE